MCRPETRTAAEGNAGASGQSCRSPLAARPGNLATFSGLRSATTSSLPPASGRRAARLSQLAGHRMLLLLEAKSWVNLPETRISADYFSRLELRVRQIGHDLARRRIHSLGSHEAILGLPRRSSLPPDNHVALLRQAPVGHGSGFTFRHSRPNCVLDEAGPDKKPPGVQTLPTF